EWAEESGPGVDVAGVDVGQRVMHEVDVVPARSGPRLDVGLRGKGEVLPLAASDLLRSVGGTVGGALPPRSPGDPHANTPSASSARYSDSSSPSTLRNA